jgi:hypothetical protein
LCRRSERLRIVLAEVSTSWTFLGLFHMTASV